MPIRTCQDGLLPDERLFVDTIFGKCLCQARLSGLRVTSVKRSATLPYSARCLRVKFLVAFFGLGTAPARARPASASFRVAVIWLSELFDLFRQNLLRIVYERNLLPNSIE